MYGKILESIEKEFDLENLKRLSTQLYVWERSFSYKNFQKSAGYCFKKFREAGLSKSRKISLRADGVTTYLDFIMPQAWYVDEAALEIVEPAVRQRCEKVLADHREEPLCVANRCAPTPRGGVIAEVVTEEQMRQAKEIKGKIVFARFSCPGEIRREVVGKKGIGIISSYSAGHVDLPDGTWWVNGWGFPGWYLTKEDTKIFCFSITPRKGEYLARLLRKSAVKVKAQVKGRIYDGSISSVTGVLPGKKEEEILLLAHMYEPFMSDNMTGVASLIEIGRMINSLIEKGELKPLRRSIRFLVSQERYGFAEYFQDRKKRKKILCAVNMDSISHDCKKTGVPISVRMSPASLPFFGDLLIQDMASCHLSPYPYQIEKGNLSDDTFISDRTIGIPTNWIWAPPGKYHHNSEDSLDRLTDWNAAKRIITVIASYVYFLAAADKKESSWIKDLVLRNMKIDLRQQCKKLAEALAGSQADYQETIEKLDFFSDWQKGRILSMERFCSPKEIQKLQREIGNVVLEEKKNLSSLKHGRFESETLSRKEKLAGNMVIERKTLCFPFSLARVPRQKRIERPQGAEQILNWADGDRDLFRILKLFKYETGKTLKDKEISYLIRYLTLLDKYGYLRIRYKRKVTGAHIKQGLRKLGIRKGDRVVVHSSLSGLGYVEGGAKAVCKALMELITKDGVLMMPSLNHYVPFKKEGSGYYSPKETPTIDGKVPDTFWRMKGVRRSLNPSHAFAVWGREAESYVRNHHRLLTMGENSPMHLLEKNGGKVVLIDCPSANTYHHVVEMTNDVPCLGKRTEEYPVKLPDGTMVKHRTWGWRSSSCPISDKGVYLKVMKEKGLLKEGKIGGASVLAFEMKDCRKIIERFLKGNVKGFRGCKNCKIRPRVVQAAVKSDWDSRTKSACL